MHQLLHRLQLHCSRVALHDVPDGLGVSLQAPDQIFVGRRHAAALELRDLHLQAPRLIGQLGNDDVPDSEALVAGFAGRELPPVSPGALVTAEARRPLRARALTGGTVALLAGDSTRVAIASWERQREMMRSRNFRPSTGDLFLPHCSSIFNFTQLTKTTIGIMGNKQLLAHAGKQTCT